ncbi:MAG: hypothetical protein Ct9H300mP1_06080 [Planctomycetaceae bacterium]|nr:MAG: hypothetical protein Ct9H300mP1_06080 [Planctomycetaceae bacterium]
MRKAKTTPGSKQTDKQKAFLKKYPNLNVNGATSTSTTPSTPTRSRPTLPGSPRSGKKIPVEDFVRALTQKLATRTAPKTSCSTGRPPAAQAGGAPGGLTVTGPEGPVAIGGDEPRSRPAVVARPLPAG